MFKSALALSALLFVSASAFAQEIKGVTLGMTHEEVLAVNPNLLCPNVTVTMCRDKEAVTVAGVPSLYKTSPVKFNDEGKVESFVFFFSAKSFDTVRDAFQAKYPEMECVSTEVQNRMGVSFTNQTCAFKNLRMQKFVGNVDTSAVSIIDRDAIAKKVQKQKAKAASDI